MFTIFVLATGCQGIKEAGGKLLGASSQVAWTALGKDGDTVIKELGEAQAEYAVAQKKAGEALGVKDQIDAALAEADTLTEKGVDGFGQSAATNLKKRSAGTSRANEILKEAAEKNVKLNAEGKKLMAEANQIMAQATVKMGKNIAETVAVCIGIKELWETGGTLQRGVAVILVPPAVTMASFVVKDGKACQETVKVLRKYSEEQGVEVPADEDLTATFGGLDDIDTGGLPTEVDSQKAAAEKK